MPEPSPPRKRFQIHLSTAIVLMLVAGGLMRANLIRRQYYMNCALYAKETVMVVPTVCYGWPFPGYFVVEHQVIPDGYVPYNIGEFAPLHRAANGDYTYIDRFPFELPIDAFIATSTLFGTWFFLERLIRRRAGRKAL